MADYSGWFDKNERKQGRKLFIHADKQIPMPLYQLTIGLVVLYGLLLNAIFSVLLTERAVLFLCSLEGLMLKLKLQYLGNLMRRADSFEKNPDAGKV